MNFQQQNTIARSNFNASRLLSLLFTLLAASTIATLSVGMVDAGRAPSHSADSIIASCTPDPEPAPEPTVTELAGDAIVMVASEGGWGSGVFIHEDGWLLTNYHVIEADVQRSATNATEARFSIIQSHWNGKRMTTRDEHLDAVVFRASPQDDLALLKVVNHPGPFPAVDLASTVKVGELCIAFGSHTRGLMWSVKPGHVSGIGTFPEDLTDNVYDTLVLGSEPVPADRLGMLRPHAEILYTTCPISSGDSGGPLLNEDGELIGLNFATPMNYSQGATGFHIALEEIRAFCSELPTEQEPVPFDLWTAGFSGTEADGPPRLRDIDRDGFADALLMYIIEPTSGREALTAFVSFVSHRRVDSERDQHQPYGLWSTEFAGSFRFDIVVQLRSDGLVVIGATDAEGRVTQIWIDRDGNGTSEHTWKLGATGQWERAKSSVVPLEQLDVSDQQFKLIQRLLQG